MPLLPLTLDGERLGLRQAPPSLGADTEAILLGLGYRQAEIEALQAQGVIASASCAARE
jgi:crotonobetainyl-CoA:carnitine CoA-transferase CaiB-like acyl-CoA transferase